MVDLQETPAVPPMDPGGDERAGYLIAGSILIALGWVLAVLLNLLVHYLAGTGGKTIAGLAITSSLGPYAWATFGFGVVVGAFGVVLIALGRTYPKGPLVLPGYDY
ncbi:MAG: hypothetical protein ACLP8Y_09690 [Thermoplasmata archaeon]